MEGPAWRTALWKRISGPWDVLVIGGGITGAGILRLASVAGLKCLLVDRKDFAWGTSSRSGKLVHGGLRYLRQGQVRVTLDSVRERERLLKEAPGLVDPIEFLLPVYRGQGRLRAAYRLGLGIYDLMAGRSTRRNYTREEVAGLAPVIVRESLQGGFGYQDACTDDARMVIRIILEAVAGGGQAINYAPVTGLLTGPGGRVSGVVVEDGITGERAEVRAGVVINATGAWADLLRGMVGRRPLIRPLRGSHLVLPQHRLPLERAVSFLHPADGRPLYALPWEGAVLAGTTDVDCGCGPDDDPAASAREKEYILSALQATFPSCAICDGDIISSFAGVRPVVGSGKKDPSKESRDMLVIDEHGLLTVTGGKLTTFRLLAIKALEAAGARLSMDIKPLRDKRVYCDTGRFTAESSSSIPARLAGRYGSSAADIIGRADQHEKKEIVPGSPFLWAEVRHAAGCEMAVHLDDILLRRLRIGLVLPGGGADLLDRIGGEVCPAMGWDRDRWRFECERYMDIWRRACFPRLKEGEPACRTI